MSHESAPKFEQEAPRDQGEKIEVHRSTAEHHEKAKASPNAEHVRHKIEEVALSSDAVRAKTEKHTSAPKTKVEHVGADTKELMYSRTLLKIRRHLSPLSRAGSKIIHQRAIESTSEAASNTVARASGLLGGGLVAFVGTTIYYYYARKYGYDYNFTVFFILFVLGFIFGWFAEVSINSLRRTK